MKNKIGPEQVRRESPGAETLCARSHTLGQRFDQVFAARRLENIIRTVILIIFWEILWGGFFYIILRLRGNLENGWVRKPWGTIRFR